MGAFTNYKKEREALERKIENTENEFQEKLDKLKDVSEYYRNKYNDQIHVINAERLAMREEIRALYNFLISFGNIEKQTTPFNYQTEDSLTSGGKASYMEKVTGAHHANAGGVLGDIAMYAVFGIAAPVIKKRNANKNEYTERVAEFEKEKLDHEEKLIAEKEQSKFYKEATDIAIIYRNILTTVRDAIKYTIMPELNDIQAFLYADAVANKISYGEDLSEGIVPSDIIELKGTKYNGHYLFVKNAFEYYKLITTMFTERILTKIVEDNEITQQEKSDFNKRINDIKAESKNLKEIALFNKEG